MSTFVYTDRTEPDSTVIEQVYYNTNTEQLHVVFANGTERTYYDVPRYVHDNLVHASSVGREYNYAVKNQYRTEARFYDYYEPEVTAEQVAYSSQIAYDADTVLSVTHAPESKITTSSFGNNFIANPSFEGINASGGTGWNEAPQTARTEKPEDPRQPRPYTVRFTVNGTEGVFNTDAPGEDEAVSEFMVLVDRLGLSLDTARVERELV